MPPTPRPGTTAGTMTFVTNQHAVSVLSAVVVTAVLVGTVWVSTRSPTFHVVALSGLAVTSLAASLLVAGKLRHRRLVPLVLSAAGLPAVWVAARTEFSMTNNTIFESPALGMAWVGALFIAPLAVVLMLQWLTVARRRYADAPKDLL